MGDLRRGADGPCRTDDAMKNEEQEPSVSYMIMIS